MGIVFSIYEAYTDVDIKTSTALMATTTIFRRNNLGMLRCVISRFDYPLALLSENQEK